MDIQYGNFLRFFGFNNQNSCIESEVLASFSGGGEGGRGGRDGESGGGVDSGGGGESGGGSGIRGGGRGAFLYISRPS